MLWNGKSLEKTVAWRTQLEQALEHGTHPLLEEWKRRGLAFPIGDEVIRKELEQTKKQEGNLRRRKKIVIMILLVLGAFFWFFARYLQAFDV